MNLRILAGVLALCTASPASALETRTLTTEVPAADLDTFVLRVDVGEVRVIGDDGDSVRVTLTLREDKKYLVVTSKKVREAIAGAELTHELMSRGRVSFSVDYPVRLTEDDRDYLDEEWEIRVPERFATRMNVNVGALNIAGLSGGVDARVSVGELEIDVPSGSIDANVGVGEIDARSATSSYGDIRLNANVGSVRLNLNGDRVKPNRPPGPSSDITIEGEGDDRLELTVSVGEASLVVQRD